MRALLRGSLPLLLCVSLLSAPACAQVLKGSQPAPAGSSILVPDHAFPGGVLTGVVLGPDDKPVANAPVDIVGGVPAVLTGEVIGEELPQATVNPGPPNRPPGPTGSPSLPPVNAPQDCAKVLQLAQGIVGQLGNQGTDHILIGLLQPSATPAGVIGPSMDAGEPGAYLTPKGGGVITDANGRFAACMGNDGSAFFKSVGGLSYEVEATPLKEGGVSELTYFIQPGQHFNLGGLLHRPSLEQGGQTWLVPAVYAISGNGAQSITAFKAPRDLAPGPVKLRYLDRNGQAHSLDGEAFTIVHATLDRSKLRSNEGADFDYEAVFSPQWGGRQLCINVGTTGPIILVKPPVERLAVNGDGHASIKGKIRATQVAPGSVVPFVIRLNVRQCGAGPQSVGETASGPASASGERAPGPQGSPSDTEMKLSLTPGPVAVNPFVQQGDKGVAVPPPVVAMKPPAPDLNGPEHTMDATSKYANAQPPISICKFQTTTPVITSVEGVTQPTVFTPQQGLNYFTVHGCNFGSTPGHVYLVLHPDFGPGFPNAVELYRMSGNNPWGPDTIAVYLDPNFGGYLDQTGDVLRVVTAKGLTAELPHQVFHAEREDNVIGWLPRSQVTLGATSDPLTPTFKTAATSQSDSFVVLGGGNRGDTVTVTATVTRSIGNVGAPFTVQDDLWDFSALRTGFVVKYATPYYQNWNGSGCNQTTGKWGTQWDSATLLRVHVQGCLQSGWHSSNAQYGLQIELRGPRGVLPWPPELH